MTDTLAIYQTFSPVAATIVGAPRIVEIAPGAHGVMCEPWRGNLLPNPSAAVNLNNISTTGSGVTILRDTAVGLALGTSVRVTCDGTAAAGVHFSCAAPTGGGTYIPSAWVWSNSGGEVVSCALYSGVTQGPAATGGGTTNYTLVPGWQRLTSPALVLGSTSSSYAMALQIATVGAQKATIWVTDAQIEMPSTATANSGDMTPTTFINGSDPSAAYTWDSSTLGPQVANGSFESDTASWASEGGSVLYTQSSGAFIGTYCAALTGVGDVYQFVSGVSVGQPFTLSWVYQPVGTMTQAPLMRVSFWSASAMIGGQTVLAMPTTGSGWSRYCISGLTSPTGTTRIQIDFTGPGTTGTALWDAIQLEQRPWATPFGSTGVAGAQSATRSRAEASVSLSGMVPGTGVPGIGEQCTIAGWTRLGTTPVISSGIMIWTGSTVGAPLVGTTGTHLYAQAGNGGVSSATIAPTTPFAAGDLLFWAMTMDYALGQCILYLGHNGSWQQSVTMAPTTLSTFSGLVAGSYYLEVLGVNTYAPRSPTELAVFNCIVPVSDLQRYWDMGPAGMDPTEDSRVQVAIGYGNESAGLAFWIQNQPINALGGVYQLLQSYTGTVWEDDGSGNALPANQRRFAIPTTADAGNPPWSGIDPQSLICGIDTADGSLTLVDDWSVVSVHAWDPNEIQVLLQRN